MNQADARTVLYDFGRDRFTAAAATVLGVLPVALRYGGLVQPEVPDGTYWARVSSQVVEEQQETLRNGSGQRRFRTDGIVTIQLFAPRAVSLALNQLDQIAELLRNDFRTYQPEGMEFTNAVIVDNVRAEPNWQRANVVSNYTYRQFIS
jgi:hypothetical protein